MLHATTVNDVTIAKFKENTRFNAVVAPRVKEMLNEYMNDKNSKLILDLDGISFIDSSGFGAMVSALKTSKLNDCEFKICNITSEVMELLQIMKLHTIFDIHSNQASALSSLK